MNIYKNFNDDELVEAYIQWIDNSGKISKELEEVLIERGNLEEVIEKANHKKLVIKEKGRIVFEINKMIDQNKSLQEIDEKISSELLEKEELSNFIIEKYIIFQSDKENSKIDTDTLNNSFIGLIVGTLAGIVFLFLIITFLRAFVFYFLIPTYIVCYQVIKLITGKTRSNLAVFITTLISTISSAVFIFLIFRNEIID